MRRYFLPFLTLFAFGACSVSPDDSFTIDISSIVARLESLRVDERADQLADWAVYGTLVREGLNANAIRDATYDIAPFRWPALASALEFGYGPGRRVYGPNDEVWLFYTASENREAVLARLADRVRMEQGTIPETLRVYAVRADSFRGTIEVEREPDLPGSELFSERFGYVEEVLATSDGLEAWLQKIDDVTHVEQRARDQGLPDTPVAAWPRIVLGGRRLEGARTRGVSLEDVAVLAQAHLKLRDRRKEHEESVTAAGQRIVGVYERLVEAFNANVEGFNEGRGIDREAFERALFRAATTLGARIPPIGNAAGGDVKSFMEAHRAAVDALEPLVLVKAQEAAEASALALLADGLIPEDPGFSLDPQWNAEGVISDLRRLTRDPGAIVREARGLLERSAPSDYELASGSRRSVTSQAFGVAAVFEGENERSYRVQQASEDRIAEILEAIEGKSGLELENGAILPFLQLLDAARRSGEDAAVRVRALLEYIQAVNRAQCARYDGAIRGTRVGMNLFYTDVLAKIWAGIDYHHSAPLRAVAGFRSLPVEGPYLEPLYWEEAARLPSTRLWFGPRLDAFKGSPEAQGLNFAPIATRVYAAGSNPLNPGQEATPAEGSRRAFDWWNQNYQAVADFEPEYHAQNQIMKWSIITGWMVDNGALADLQSVEVDRSLRFDRWYAASDELRFRHDVRFLPEDRWLGDTECIEILTSYMFPGGGNLGNGIEGGVSLGGRKSLGEAAQITPAVPKKFRRGATDYTKSRRDSFRTVKKTEFRVPDAAPGSPARVAAHAAEEIRLRSGGSEFVKREISTEVSVPSPGRASIRVDSGEIPIAQLQVNKTKRGVRIGFRDGAIESDRGLLQASGRAFGAPRSRRSQAVASQRQLMASRNDFVVEQGGDASILRTASGGAKEPPQPPREIRMAAPPGADPPPKRYLKTSAEDPAWMLKVILTGQARPTRLDVLALEASDVNTRLGRLGWQRLHPTESSRPGDVGRVFTNNVPEGIDVVIETPTAGPIEARVADGKLFLKRTTSPGSPGSPGPPERRNFEHLVLDEGFTSDSVRKVIDEANAGVEKFGPPLDENTARGFQAARHLENGEPQESLALLEAARDAGGFDPAFRTYSDQVAKNASFLDFGTASPAADTFARALSFDDGLRVPAVRAQQALQRGQPGEAAEAMRAATMAREYQPPDPHLLDSIRKSGGSPAAEYLQAMAGEFEGLSPRIARQLEPRVVGRRVQPTSNLRIHPRRRLPPEERSRVFEQLDWVRDVYAEEHPGLNFDHSPFVSLARLEQMPNVEIDLLSTAGLGEFRPAAFAEGQKIFPRREITSQVRPGEPPQDLIDPVTGDPYIVLIRFGPTDGALAGGEAGEAAAGEASQATVGEWFGCADTCDSDGDGLVSDRELIECGGHCDLDGDGTVSSDEASSCACFCPDWELESKAESSPEEPPDEPSAGEPTEES